MASLEVFNPILRARDGGVYGLVVSQNFYSMKTPKLHIAITNPPKEKGGKGRYAEFYINATEAISFIRKLKAAVAHNRQEQSRAEFFKLYKGGPDKKNRYGGGIVSRIFSLSAEKGRSYLKIEVSKGVQVMTKNGAGKSVPGVVKPAGGPPLESVSFALNDETALDLAFVLEKEYTAWRTTLNIDFFYHQDKYEYRGNQRNGEPQPAPEMPPRPTDDPSYGAF